MMLADKLSLETTIDELAKSATNLYTASLPLIASAELGDAKRYQFSRKQMLEYLSNFTSYRDEFPEWMCNASFKAWMWGRVLLAANKMDDKLTVLEAKSSLIDLLENPLTEHTNPAFLAWAWGYRAALNLEEYQHCREKMLEGAKSLNETYLASKSQANLANALWAWIMNSCASANVSDQETYEIIKKEFIVLTNCKTVAAALENGLLRTAESNDYPAWALAKMCLAASTMNDVELYNELNSSLAASIDTAKQNKQQAEYMLAITINHSVISLEPEILNTTNLSNSY